MLQIQVFCVALNNGSGFPLLFYRYQCFWVQQQFGIWPSDWFPQQQRQLSQGQVQFCMVRYVWDKIGVYIYIYIEYGTGGIIYRHNKGGTDFFDFF